MQVGRFAVRMRGAKHLIADHAGGSVREARTFVVDHINTGICMGDFGCFADAVAYADDVSRFCVRDAASHDYECAAAQMGDDILDWTQDQQALGRFVPFRQWRDGRRAA
jgi:hypothetical protein